MIKIILWMIIVQRVGLTLDKNLHGGNPLSGIVISATPKCGDVNDKEDNRISLL